MLNNLLDKFVAERTQLEKDETNATYDVLLQDFKLLDKFVAERIQLEKDEMNKDLFTLTSTHQTWSTERPTTPSLTTSAQTGFDDWTDEKRIVDEAATDPDLCCGMTLTHAALGCVLRARGVSFSG